MRQSVYTLTALFAGIALGVLAAEIGDPVDSANAPETPSSRPQIVLDAEPTATSTHEFATIGTPGATVDSRTLEHLLQELERADQERRALLARHEDLQMQIERLEERLALASGLDVGATPQPPTVDAGDLESPPASAPAETEDSEMQALLAAGLDPYQAAEIRRRAGEAEMERLYLRDRAIREDWFGGERYQQELEALQDPERSLRTQMGDQAFDRYLYAGGDSNRIRIQSVIEASPAAAAGIEAGDILYRYAGERVFSTSDLRSAIADGSAGESVSVEISRDGSRRSFYVSRGPLGVRLAPARVEPQG